MFNMWMVRVETPCLVFFSLPAFYPPRVSPGFLQQRAKFLNRELNYKFFKILHSVMIGHRLLDWGHCDPLSPHLALSLCAPSSKSASAVKLRIKCDKERNWPPYLTILSHGTQLFSIVGSFNLPNPSRPKYNES